jgi:hypothetical protein
MVKEDVRLPIEPLLEVRFPALSSVWGHHVRPGLLREALPVSVVLGPVMPVKAYLFKKVRRVNDGKKKAGRASVIDFTPARDAIMCVTENCTSQVMLQHNR